ncbi:MAG: trypsin-like peptidase domain-containing protein [Pirellulales bacterium]|nr:trypsin-like peptidase domain-containing protein [Pirellulales bacterium]
MRRLFCCLMLSMVGLIAGVTSAAGQCGCENGTCTVMPERVHPSPFALHPSSPTLPSPAWRYAAPRGHYRSVVRVQTVDRDGSRSFGSGVAVRWGNRLVVLTARHVVRDAKEVWVRGHQGYRAARVLRTDATWDVAALATGTTDGFEPAEIAWRATGHPRAGDRLESCGFGADGRLAVNGGRFLGYRSTLHGSRAADWLVLSGRARQGDSGGPVFNAAGQLVGVLWGTDGSEVIATQCGRLHVFLRQAVGEIEEESVKGQVRKANPAVDEPRLVAVNRSQPTGLGTRRPWLPLCPSRRPAPEPRGPQVIVQSSPALESIDRKMDIVIRNTTPAAERPEASPSSTVQPVVVLLVVAGAVALGFVVYFATQRKD